MDEVDDRINNEISKYVDLLKLHFNDNQDSTLRKNIDAIELIVSKKLYVELLNLKDELKKNIKVIINHILEDYGLLIDTLFIEYFSNIVMIIYTIIKETELTSLQVLRTNISTKVGGKITKETLNELSKYDWTMIEVDRGIDINKATKYLQSITNMKDKGITKDIIDNTIYIPFNVFYNELIKLIDRLPSKFNLLFDIKEKVGSEHWITLLIWSYIKDNVINIINDIDDVTNEYPILIVDDSIYSGHHLSGVMDEFSYNYKNKFNKKLENSFVILVPYASEIGVDTINNALQHININADIIYGNKLQDISFHIYDYNERYMYDNFMSESIPTGIYFDHKIAGNFSSFPLIYKEIVKEQPSRYKIEELKFMLEKV